VYPILFFRIIQLLFLGQSNLLSNNRTLYPIEVYYLDMEKPRCIELGKMGGNDVIHILISIYVMTDHRYIPKQKLQLYLYIYIGILEQNYINDLPQTADIYL
jgi:hypothetical protein